MRGGDAEECDVVVLEDVPRVHVLLVLAAKVVQLVVLKTNCQVIVLDILLRSLVSI